MFVRLAGFYCLIAVFFHVIGFACVAEAQTTVTSSGQWKPSHHPAEGRNIASTQTKSNIVFRKSRRFEQIQLPAPIDTMAQTAVAPIVFHQPSPAARGHLPAVRGQQSGRFQAQAAPVLPSTAVNQVQQKARLVGRAPTLPLATQNNASPLPQVASRGAAAMVQAPPVAQAQSVMSSGVQAAAHFSSGDGTLPNDHGQIWREYDISPYTLRVQNVQQPEQALVDWVIRETGTQVWFSDPLGILSATRTTLRVYHTPEMQAVVKGIVDRFVAGQTDAYSFGVRLLTVNNPNWREALQRSMRPVSVQTPGIQAWIMSKEDAAILVSELSRRSDYREYNSTNLLIHNGQSGKLSHVKPTSYIKNVLFSGDAFGSYQPELGEIREGYDLNISPLVTTDGKVVDCVLKCKVDQVERLMPVNISVPTQLNPGQKVQVQVPQLVSWRVHERFRWPADQVLVLSCGVVAKPGGGKTRLLGLPNVPNPFAGAPRADAMMILEAKGTVAAPLASQAPAGSGVSTPAFQTGSLNSYHGRY